MQFQSHAMESGGLGIPGDTLPVSGDKWCADDDSEEMAKSSTRTAKSLMVHGWLQVLFGCVSCLVLDAAFGEATPAIGTVHKIGCIQGALLVGAAGSWHFLKLSPANQWQAWGCLMCCVWPNVIGPCIAAATGASANGYDRSFTCSMLTKARFWNFVVALGIQSAAFILPAIAMILFGALAPQRRWWQKLAFGVAVLFEIGVVLVILSNTVFAPSGALVDPNLDDATASKIFVGTPGGRERQALCPFVTRHLGSHK
mmetsp:Transcript_76584/g.234491  ORF Transcript_76584/g.234491 Transcript_76584/m.234491 type:complete len:256 (-) Transcript_76584:401-1168(-)